MSLSLRFSAARCDVEKTTSGEPEGWIPSRDCAGRPRARTPPARRAARGLPAARGRPARARGPPFRPRSAGRRIAIRQQSANLILHMLRCRRGGSQGWQGLWAALTTQRPAPPSAPGLAWVSRSPRRIFPRPRNGLAFSRISLRRRAPRACSIPCLRAAPRALRLRRYAARARIRAPRRHAMRYATMCGGIMNDAVLVRIRECANDQVDTDQQERQN